MAQRFGVSPYQILKEDADETIAFFNTIVETTPTDEEHPQTQPARRSTGKEKRIKVNDKTATGGWF